MASKSLEKLRSSGGNGSEKLQSIYKLDTEIRKQVRNVGKKKGTLQAPKDEKQGPIDWSHQGIKSKYRGAEERENAWNIWKQAMSLSKTLLEDDHKILPVVRVERHPIFAEYYKLLAEENSSSNQRTRSRLLMKRFVFDVQEIWLSNLQHLKEHQTENIHNGEGLDEDYQRGEGIANRRDAKAILNLEHQVQSVSQKRVFANAYHTSRLPPIQVVLDYKPIPPPILPEPRPMIPQFQLLMKDIIVRENEEKNGFYYPPEQSLSNTSAFLLTIDRMIPPMDLVSNNTLPDILWRFSLIDSMTLNQRIALASETQVATFVSQLITSQLRVSTQSSDANVSYRSEQYVPIPFLDGSVEWEGQVDVSLSRSSTNPFISGLASLSINLTVHLRPHIPPSELLQHPELHSLDGPQIVLSLQCSPIEVEGVLRRSDTGLFSAATAVGSPYAWEYWSSEDRLGDCWIPLSCQCLALETDSFGNTLEVRRQPVGLMLCAHSKQLLDEDGNPAVTIHRQLFWEKLEGALTDLQALSCCYELLKSLQLSSQSEAAVPMINFVQSSTGHNLPFQFNHCNDQLRYALEPQDPLSANPSPPAQRMTIQSLATSGQWENVQRECPLTLSMEVAKLYDRVSVVPGSMVIGKKGIWQADMNDPTRENTQVAVNFFRDEVRSTSNTVLVNSLLALDTAVLFPPMIAWESFSQKPPPNPNEEVHGPIPTGALKHQLLV